MTIKNEILDFQTQFFQSSSMTFCIKVSINCCLLVEDASAEKLVFFFQWNAVIRFPPETVGKTDIL